MSETADYNRVFAEYFKAIVGHGEFTEKNNILLDLGCGTGNLSKRFAGAGFDVLGVDLSEDMLSIAAEKCAGLDIRFIKQDIRKLDLYGTVNVTVAAFDVLNHLTDLTDLRDCFKKVYLFTEPGGVFLFDYNTIYYHEEVLASNTFNYDYDDFFCSWENDCDDDYKVTMNINVFEKTGDLYRRFNETIIEKTFKKETIIELLTECGFTVEIKDFYTGLDYIRYKTEKILFTAIKKP
jgi:SAM-dependent methyltransferase